GPAGGTAWGTGVAFDPSGNVVTTGGFQGTVNFGGSTFTSGTTNATGTPDLYVAKFNSSGTHLYSWAATGTDNANWAIGTGVAVDAGGNIFVTGYFGGTVNFGTGPEAASGSTAIFVVKLSPALVPAWVNVYGNTGYDKGLGIAVAP